MSKYCRNSNLFPRGPIRQSRYLMLALLGMAMFGLSSRGDVIILKDGYSIHGKVGTEQTMFTDPLTGVQIVTRKMNGFNTVDDGPRWTVFSAHYKRVGEVSEYNKFQEYVQVTRPIYRKTAYPMPATVKFAGGTEFNDRWQRTVYYRDVNQPQLRYQIEQQIDILTPHYARINSYTHLWSSYYLTRELGAEKVRKLLSTHPDFAEKNGQADVDKRAKLVRFLVQADWLDEADEEIERLLKDLPGEAKRADTLRATIRDSRLEKLIVEIEQAKESGRHAFALSALKQVPRDKIPANLTLKIAGFKAEYEAMQRKYESGKRYLKELQSEIKTPAYKDLVQAAEIVISELHVDTTSRLEEFITLAEQAEKARKAGKSPSDKPEVLIAAAINGWLMGNTSTETSISVARKRLKARNLALAYLRNSSSLKRREMLLDYQKDPDALPFDELEKLISLLPPPEAEKELSTTRIEKKTGPLPGLAVGVNYLLQLPPEYQHGRSYPLLMVLPNGGQRMADILKSLGDIPAKNGYIVAVVDWTNNGVQTTYGYSEEEQAAVTGLLRHLRRTLQVDSDRVFLFGFGEGANMALDVGSAHPDQFAGVIPMTPSPDFQMFQVFEYWKNFQNLPVYMIIGDRAGESIKIIRNILTAWMPKGYPAIAVSYKGRGPEWFGGDLPYIFDWMGRKTRATALPDLGRVGEEYRSVRPFSNRFYWLSTNEIDPASLFNPQRKNKILLPATVSAKIVEGNQIIVNELGLRQLTIWLGRGTVDFAKPIVVTLKDRGSWKKDLTPQISVLLEDLYERGDRQRPYFQRIDCSDLNRVVKFSAP